MDLTKQARNLSIAERIRLVEEMQDLDLEFMQCIDDALSRITLNPFLFPAVYRKLRRVVVRRFPFAIFYEFTSDEIQVVAVFHLRRDPEMWKTRAG